MNGESAKDKFAPQSIDTGANDSTPNTIESPSLSLPKGGGAIQGIGEKFSANPVTGTGTFSVPISTSPGRSGFGPQLSLSYDSGTGNGPFGFGWTLALPQISRKTSKGIPRYNDAEESDVFLISGAEDLVPVINDDLPGDSEYTINRYRPRIEGLFARIERWTRKHDGDVHWRSISKDNVLSIYGKSPASRIFSPDNTHHIFSWLLCESRDDKGNVILYEYKSENGIGIDLSLPSEANRGGREDDRRETNRYIKHIRYGNETSLLINGRRPRFLDENTINQTHWMFEIVFDYGEHNPEQPMPDDTGDWLFRDDPFSNYRSGFEIRTTRLCHRVLMFHHFPGEQGVGNNCLTRSTDFTYSHQQQSDNSNNPIYTFLNKATHSGYKLKSDGTYIKRNLPPLEFTYSKARLQQKIEKVDPASLENLPTGVDGSAYQWVDLHGEGTPGILTEQAGNWFYKRNISPMHRGEVAFSALHNVRTKPGMSLTAGAKIMDLAGDGSPDIVMLDGLAPGYHEHDDDEGWNNFKAFTSRLNRDMQDPDLRFLDLNGDGHADILISEDDAFVWHASLAESGYGPAQKVIKTLDEETGPRIVFADGTQSIYLADFSGDGLTDLVRIRNTEVCYWPNLGYGRFGAKIRLNNAPHFDHPDQYSQQRIRLADIDGSGSVDIIYLHRDGVHLYFNQSGNSLSDVHKLTISPRVNDLVSIKVADLFGTACLVWSSSLPTDKQQPMRYVNLMGDQKPHLLIKSSNNLGAETEIHYAPSTKFYLQDKYNGQPWITRLPFPVHVVERVTSRDKWRQTTFSSTYSYHHGYFDGVEREFRGFGRVEQLDIEHYGTFLQGNVSSPYITDDKTLYQPPVKTITWFHTGAFISRDKILNQFEHEYFPNNLNQNQQAELRDFQEKQLSQPDLNEQNLTPQEWREALRACKGMTLRQEVYELDIDALQQQGLHQPKKLFSTAYNSYQIQRLQPQADNRHAVFLVTGSEAISYNYELNLHSVETPPGIESPLDPRISHVLNLNTDAYANVLQSVTAVYPRRNRYRDASLPDGAEELIYQVQQETHLAYTENRFTNNDVVNDIDDYRLPLPCEALSYELTGISTPAGSDYFDLQQMRQYWLSDVHQNQGTEVEDIAYQQMAHSENPQKRLLQHTRTLYFSDDLSAPLAQGEHNSLALPYESYTLAMTDELLNSILKEKFTDTIQTDLAASDHSGYLYLQDEGQYWIRSGIAGFADDAAEHFFLPEQYTDPFGNTTILQYDRRDLYITRSTDPVGNQVQIKSFDYRVLQPSEMEDINGNLSEVVFDVLGLPTAAAVKGKGNEGDSLENFTVERINPDINTRIQFFNDHYQEAEARKLLSTATVRHIYDFGEQVDEDGVISYGHRPASGAAILREQHVASLSLNNTPTGIAQPSPLQVAFEYIDGGGNVLVSKVQAEPETAGGPQRWIANGKTILNNKGKPVKQYEPYFIDSHTFAEPIEVGVTPVMYYDAAGRLIRTELPDGTINRVEFSQWHVSSYDANDTVLDPDNLWYQLRIAATATAEEQRAASLAAVHANTPASVFLDSLGREVISIEFNKFKDNQEIIHEEKYLTFSKLDAEGKPLWVRDARGNLVMYSITRLPRATEEADPENPEHVPEDTVPCYDIAGNLLFQHSMDAGDRWLINDASGQPFYAWDMNERVTDSGAMIDEERIYHTRYDALRRPLEQQLSINNEETLVVERFTYRDPGLGSATSDAEAAVRNLGGHVFQHYDPSGLISNQRFDFKGNLLEVQRRLASAYQATAIHWPEQSPATAFEAETYTQQTEYDALNRMVRLYNWHQGEGSRVAVYEPEYNQRGVLQAEALVVGATRTATGYNETRPESGPDTADRRPAERTQAIVDIVYDAKGQRTHVDYGNSTRTHYEYDPNTFRLIHLLTTKTGTSTRLQDLHYTYDPVGNLTAIRDDAQQRVFFNNTEIQPHCHYEYDALYRLIRAKGREHAAQNNIQRDAKKIEPGIGIPFHNSPEALQRYEEHYQYDSVGNILAMTHTGGSEVRWKRCYQYAQNSNRLLATGAAGELPDPNDDCSPHYVEIPSLSQRYAYDTHGSMLTLNRTPVAYYLRWDYRDMIRSVNLGGGGKAWYNYDAVKQRSRKRIERTGNNEIEERIYLGGLEIYRRWENEELVEEIETHHLFVGQQRVLIVEDVGITDDDDLGAQTLYKYQYSNHLGSVGLELDDSAEIISYEEYHPFGTTAFSANNKEVRSTRKRYRYTGMERDEETGLSYHTARYYLPWLGRWVSADPIGINAGINVYGYCGNNPIVKSDVLGEQEWCGISDGFFGVSDDECHVNQRVYGAIQMIGGGVETYAGGVLIFTGVTTSEIGIGIPIAAAGVVVVYHGVDTAYAGFQTMKDNKEVDTYTSTVLQDAGMSRTNANLADAGISIVGSFGAGTITAISKVNTLRLIDPAAKGMSTWKVLWRANKGAKALGWDDFTALGGKSTTDLDKAELIAKGVNAAGETYKVNTPVLIRGLVALKLTPTGPTALGNVGVGIWASAAGTVKLGRHLIDSDSCSEDVLESSMEDIPFTPSEVSPSPDFSSINEDHLSLDQQQYMLDIESQCRLEACR